MTHTLIVIVGYLGPLCCYPVLVFGEGQTLHQNRVNILSVCVGGGGV